MIFLLLIVFGLCFGSFLAAYTWRLEHDISIAKGRSFCDRCKFPIEWFDNIPLFSYLFLRGKCRHCKKHISARYPIIEASTAIFFVLVYLLYPLLLQSVSWLSDYGLIGIVFVLFMALLSIGIIVTDIEEMIIPDTFVFVLLFVSFFFLLFSSDTHTWMRLFVAFSSGTFFLLINLLTKGKGMGLGDVKLALPFGLILGFPLSVSWIFLSFIIGAVIGVLLLLFGKAGAKTRIPFGPFMVVSFWICIFCGQYLLQYITPLF